MNTKLAIKDILNTVTTSNLALVNPTGTPTGYQIIEYIRTAQGIKPYQHKTGSLELLLDFVQHIEVK